MRRLKLICPLLVITLLISSVATAQNRWEPYNELGDFYPSFALAIANVPDSAADGKDETNIGDPNGIIGIVFTPAHDDTRVRIQLVSTSIPALFSPATLDVTLPEAGAEYRLTPTVLFNQAKLASIRQPVTASITYTVTVDGKLQPPRTEPLRVHSLNDCPLVMTDNDDDGSMDWTLAAYVDEDHLGIKQVLDEALRNRYVDAFVGYQGGEPAVYQQVLAVWRVLQERGLRYTNLDGNASAGTRDVPVQTIRLPGETIQTTQATCADGSVLIASVLRKMGLNPVLVVIPGHLFVGFDLDEGGEKQVYLETTLLGVTPDYTPALEKQLADQLLTGVTAPKAQAAVRSLVAAIESGNQTYAQHKSRLQGEANGYAAVDIDETRQAGIRPIPRK